MTRLLMAALLLATGCAQAIAGTDSGDAGASSTAPAYVFGLTQQLRVENNGRIIASVGADGGVHIAAGHTCEEALQIVARSVSR